MSKRLITVLGVISLLLLTSCDINNEGEIRDDDLNTNSVSSNAITSHTSENSTSTKTTTDFKVGLVVAQKLDITMASTYECFDIDILEKDVLIVSEDESIDRVYYSPNEIDFIITRLEDLVYDHKKTYILNDNEVWKHYMEYKELPLYKNFSSQPIWISDEEVFLSDMGFDFQKADNKLIGLDDDGAKKRMFLGDVSNIRGFSINDEYTKIALNNDVEYGSDELNGLLIYDIENDSIDILKETTFNVRNRHFYNSELIEEDIYSYAFESNLRQNMVWGKDGYIYYTDAVLDESLISRIDRINPNNQEYETLLENAYILCESPDKTFMVYNDLNEQKTVIWNMDLNKKFVIDLSYEFTWDHAGQRAIYKPVDSEEHIYLIEFVNDKVQISTLDVKSYTGENMRVVNLQFDQIGNIMFDVLVNKYAEKEMADYVEKVITYEVEVEKQNQDHESIKRNSDDEEVAEVIDHLEERLLVTVLGSRLNVRKEATTDSQVVGAVVEWDSYEVIETVHDEENRPWYKVKLTDHEVGWIAGWYCSETHNDDVLGHYVTLTDVDDFNVLLTNYGDHDLSKNGEVVTMDELQAVTTDFSHVGLDNGEYKSHLSYERDNRFMWSLSDTMDIIHPIFLDEETLLYIMCDENDKQYLVKKNVFNDLYEIIYSMNIEGINARSSDYDFRVMSLTDHHIVYKIDNHVIVYNREDDIVEAHNQYENLEISDISNDLTRIIVDQEYSDYVTSIDLLDTSYIFEWNNGRNHNFLGPIARFSETNMQLINIGVNGYEWRAGEYAYNMQSGGIYNLGYSSENSQFSESHYWEYAIDSSSEYRFMCVYDYDLGDFKVTAIISDLSTIFYLNDSYTFPDTTRQFSYDLGEPLYNQAGDLVFFDLVKNVEHSVTGIESTLEFECGNKAGDLLLFSNEERYFLYKKIEE